MPPEFRASNTDLLFRSAAFQIRAFSSAGRRTRLIRSPQRRSCSSALIPPYSCTLDHFQSCALFTRPRRTGFRWMYSTVSTYPFHSSQCAVEEATQPQLPYFSKLVVDRDHRAGLHGLNHPGNAERKRWADDCVPMVGQKHPRGEQKAFFLAYSGEGKREARIVPLLKVGP